MSSPEPNLKLSTRSKPHQKITIKKMPKEIYDLVKLRSDTLGKKIPTYCQIVLESAMEHQTEYKGKFKNPIKDDDTFGSEINIPLISKDFLKNLVAWDPFGDEKKSDIALNILRKHLEVHEW
jgi:hypothetical protein